MIVEQPRGHRKVRKLPAQVRRQFAARYHLRARRAEQHAVVTVLRALIGTEALIPLVRVLN